MNENNTQTVDIIALCRSYEMDDDKLGWCQAPHFPFPLMVSLSYIYSSQCDDYGLSRSSPNGICCRIEREWKFVPPLSHIGLQFHNTE